jgi:predicted oxidoreductase
MTELKVTEVNCATGEEIVRDATVEEIAQREADIAAETVKQAEAEAKATARAAILDRLGLTAEEAAILLS